jgi:hypothetical protein
MVYVAWGYRCKCSGNIGNIGRFREGKIIYNRPSSISRFDDRKLSRIQGMVERWCPSSNWFRKMSLTTVDGRIIQTLVIQ